MTNTAQMTRRTALAARVATVKRSIREAQDACHRAATPGPERIRLKAALRQMRSTRREAGRG